MRRSVVFGLVASAFAVGAARGQTPADSSAPRDTLIARSQTVLDSTDFARLPITDPQTAFDFAPGVIPGYRPIGISVRGTGAPTVYVDGVPIQRGLILGTNGIARATLITGGLPPSLGNAESGVLAYVTKTGGSRLGASLRYRTDAIGLWRNVGFNRIEATVGGPAGPVSFFTALTLDGQQSLETEASRDVEAPVYVMSGVDTIVHEPVQFGVPNADTVDVAIPRFVQYSGYCDASKNYGSSCQGLRVPFTANGSLAWQGRLSHDYGSGSIGLTALVSQVQARDFPGPELYNPGEYTGTRTTNSALILGWSHSLASLGAPVTLEVHVAREASAGISGIITPQADLDSRDPFGGFLLKPLQFLVDFNTTHDVTIGTVTTTGVHFLDDTEVRCLLEGNAHCTAGLTPYPITGPDIGDAQPFRMNPYGVELSGLYPLPTQGLEIGPTLDRQSDWQQRVELTWSPRFQVVRLGFENQTFDVRHYNSGLATTFDMSAYHETPARQGAYLEDDVAVGGARLVAGLRWDRFDSHALYPKTPGRITTDTVPFDVNDPTKFLVPAAVHTSVSGRLAAAVRVMPDLDVRIAVSRQEELPDFANLFAGKNTDLALTNNDEVFGRDAPFVRTDLIELDEHARLPGGLVADAVMYTKRVADAPEVRLLQLPDPLTGSTSDFLVFTLGSQGSISGVEASLQRPIGMLGRATLAFTDAAPTGYGMAPEGLAGTLSLATPAAWRRGTELGDVLANFGLVATVRASSGRAYTLLRQAGVGETTDTPFGLGAEPLNGSQLPWVHIVDVRVTRGVILAGRRATVFAEATNLFNVTNTLGVYTETGGVTNALYEQRFIDGETQSLLSEASAAGYITTDANGRPEVDLSSPGACANWQGLNPGAQATAASSGPVDCVLLLRAEQRFGNGDGIFTEKEYDRAFAAWYNLAHAPYQFYGAGRRIRIGLDVTF